MDYTMRHAPGREQNRLPSTHFIPVEPSCEGLPNNFSSGGTYNRTASARRNHVMKTMKTLESQCHA